METIDFPPFSSLRWRRFTCAVAAAFFPGMNVDFFFSFSQHHRGTFFLSSGAQANPGGRSLQTARRSLFFQQSLSFLLISAGRERQLGWPLFFLEGQDFPSWRR